MFNEGSIGVLGFYLYGLFDPEPAIPLYVGKFVAQLVATGSQNPVRWVNC